MIRYTIYNAHVGEAYDISMNPDEVNVSALRNTISEFQYANIPPSHQILLIGPAPFHSLDNQLLANTPQEPIYVFDRRMLAIPSSSHKEVSLLPNEIYPYDNTNISTNSDLQQLTVILKEAYVTPLLRALPDYDIHFLVRLREGEALLKTCRECYDSCRLSCDQQKIQSSGLDAAISNLEVVYNSVQSSFETFTTKLLQQQEYHESLLNSFEDDIKTLQSIELSPELIDLYYRESDSGFQSTNRPGSESGFNLGENPASSSPMVCSPPASFRYPQTNSSLSTPAHTPSHPPPNIDSSVRMPGAVATPPPAGSNLSLKTIRTLSDCVSVEKEAVWAEHCAETHRKVNANVEELKKLFATVTESVQDTLLHDMSTNGNRSASPSGHEGEASQAINVSADVGTTNPVVSEKFVYSYDVLEQHVAFMRHAVQQMEQHVTTLRNNHENVVLVIKNTVEKLFPSTSSSLYGSSTSGGGGSRISSKGSDEPSVTVSQLLSDNNGTGIDNDVDLPGIITALDTLHRTQDMEVYIPMKQLVSKAMSFKEEVALSHTHVIRHMSRSLRKVADLQTMMQVRLKKEIEVVKKWSKGNNQYSSRLELISKLPDAYEAFLYEIDRRRQFHQFYEDKSKSFMMELERMKSEEISRRSSFMKEHGVNLPPLFYTIVPSLRDAPSGTKVILPEHPVLPVLPLPMTPKVPNSCVEKVDESLQDPSSSGHCSEHSSSDVTFLTQSSASKMQAKCRELEFEKCLLEARVRSMEKCLFKSAPKDATSGTSSDEAVKSMIEKHEAEELELRRLRESMTSILEFINERGQNVEAKNLNTASDGTELVSRLQEIMQSTQPMIVNPSSDATNMIISNTDEGNKIEDKLSFTKFEVGDVALFLPLANNVYMAFHQNCPNNYLSPETVAALHVSENRVDKSSQPLPYILGRIVEMNVHEVDGTDGTKNPFNLPLGTIFHTINVEKVGSVSIKRQMSK